MKLSMKNIKSAMDMAKDPEIKAKLDIFLQEAGISEIRELLDIPEEGVRDVGRAVRKALQAHR